MSQAAAAARATARPAGRAGRPAAPARPALRVVSAAHPRPQLRLAIGAMALLAAGLVVLLMLNISLSRGSYELYRGQQQQRDLDEQAQSLREQLMAQQAPQRLAARARALGMVPAANPAFVRLPDGTVVGVPQQATAPPKPKPAATPGATATPKPGATAAKTTKATTKATGKPGGTATTKPGATTKPKPAPTAKPTP